MVKGIIILSAIVIAYSIVGYMEYAPEQLVDLFWSP